MTRRYRSASGSVYEIDEARRMIRRPYRSDASQSDRPGDGEWLPYHSVEFANGCLWIDWGYRDGLMRTTLTSPVTEEVLQ